MKITNPADDASWAPVAELCARVLDDLDRLAHDSVTNIRRDLDAYAVVPFDEHLAAVTEQQRRRLEALAGRRLLAEGDLERAAELARRRARQGIAVDVLIGAYHLGDQELWGALCRDPRSAAPLLPEVAALMLRLLHAISTVLASAHGEVMRELQTHRVTLSQRLIELLLAGRDDAEASRVADALGLDPQASFVAGLWRRSDADVVLPPEVRRELDRAAVPLVHSAQSGLVVVLVQGAEPEWLDELLSALDLGPDVGIGLRRPGLAGAVLSLGDARLALALRRGDRSRGRAVRRRLGRGLPPGGGGAAPAAGGRRGPDGGGASPPRRDRRGVRRRRHVRRPHRRGAAPARELRDLPAPALGSAHRLGPEEVRPPDHVGDRLPARAQRKLSMTFSPAMTWPRTMASALSASRSTIAS